MAKNKIHWCYKGLLPVYFGFCPNKKAWDKEMKRRKIKEPYPDSDARATYFSKKGLNFILVSLSNTKYDSSKNLVEVTGLLAHEALHVLQFQKQHMGEESSPAEYDAYSLQYIYQSLYSEYLKCLAKKLR